MLNRVFPPNIIFILKHYLLGLFFFTILRLFFFNSNTNGIYEGNEHLFEYAFKTGLQFDTVVLGYILALPSLLSFVFELIKYKVNYQKFLNIFISVLMVVAFLIACIDIPYFNHNFSRVSAVMFNWMSNFDTVSGMILEEPSYIKYSILFVVLSALYVFIVYKYFGKKNVELELPKMASKIVLVSLSLLLFFGNFLAIRGRLESPIRINHAFFCDNAFYNQLGLNPSFTLLKSYLSKPKLMDDKEALQNVKEYLNINSDDNSIARKITFDKPSKKMNVILVLMESMSAHKMKSFGNPQDLTPYLDSLSNHSLNFSNFYSAGKHTYNGIFSTLYSYPAIFRYHPMSSSDIKEYSGLPVELKRNNYNTIYFTTHSPNFDNLKGFLPKNGIDEIVSVHNYDQSKIQSSLGVPDHVMFNYSIGKLDKLASKNEPFFATLMTISDHGPYIIPPSIKFKPSTGDIHTQIVEYADWSIQQFMNQIQKKEWFENTIIVFVADHGGIVGEPLYDLPLSFHHSPCIIYSKDTSVVKTQQNKSFGGQIDVFPTIMGMLNIDYTNNTMGIDLLKEKRPFMYFSSDDKLACINEDFYYVYRLRGEEGLYNYRKRDRNNISAENKSQLEVMKKYVFSMTQASNYLIENDKVK